MGKSRRGIDNGPFEGKSLAFVDGDGPCQSERKLRKGANYVGGDFFGSRVDGVANILPLSGRNHQRIAVGLPFHKDDPVLLIDANDPANFAVVKQFLPRRIIFNEHHLRPHFQRQLGIGGVS